MDENSEISLVESELEFIPIPYSKMTEEDAQIAFSARKQQIKSMLKARSAVQTPDSLISKRKSSKSKNSHETPHKFPIGFTVDPEKLSKHSIDIPLFSQQQLRERLKKYEKPEQIEFDSKKIKKYDVNEPLYKRTVEWKQNLKKRKEEKSVIKQEEILGQCTFEPNIAKNEIKYAEGIYTRNIEWKNSIMRRNEMIQDQNRLKEVEECSFKPKLISASGDFSVDFQARNEIWQERVFKKMKRIEEESTKDHVFYPKIIVKKSKLKNDQFFENRFENFLSKLDEISEKIETSLAKPVLSQFNTIFNNIK